MYERTTRQDQVLQTMSPVSRTISWKPYSKLRVLVPRDARVVNGSLPVLDKLSGKVHWTADDQTLEWDGEPHSGFAPRFAEGRTATGALAAFIRLGRSEDAEFPEEAARFARRWGVLGISWEDWRPGTEHGALPWSPVDRPGTFREPLHVWRSYAKSFLDMIELANHLRYPGGWRRPPTTQEWGEPFGPFAGVAWVGRELGADAANNFFSRELSGLMSAARIGPLVEWTDSGPQLRLAPSQTPPEAPLAASAGKMLVGFGAPRGHISPSPGAAHPWPVVQRFVWPEGSLFPILVMQLVESVLYPGWGVRCAICEGPLPESGHRRRTDRTPICSPKCSRKHRRVVDLHAKRSTRATTSRE